MHPRYRFTRHFHAVSRVAFALWCSAAGIALAGEPAVPATGAATQAPVLAVPIRAEVPPGWLQVRERAVLEIGAPVDVARLAGMRGGEDDHGSAVIIDVDGTVDGNTADRIISGGNTISQGAFDNANGINTVIQNTGTNVLIQNAMVVTVNFADPGR
ncbi:hypothetical protein ACWKWK_12220 [Pseudoxanthomonas beigongshangi]